MYYPPAIFNHCIYCRNAQWCRIRAAILDNYYRDLMFQMSNDSLNYPQVICRQTKEFTLSELAQYDGTMGKPAYVAVNGIVYDVSNEATWGGASHFGLMAGKDLSSQFQGCHGNISVLAKLPRVGILKQ